MNALQTLQAQAGVNADGVFGPITLRAAASYLGLSNDKAAHFFAQCAHESANFKTFSENLNYSTKGLLAVFGKYFTPVQAADYARKPQRIANRVYGNRMGNGPEESGDGWKFRGRGPLQLTGRNNYQLFSAYVNDETLLQDPTPVETTYAFKSAIWFFDTNRLWGICAQGVNDESIKTLTKRINGGTNGLEHRAELTYKYAQWLS